MTAPSSERAETALLGALLLWPEEADGILDRVEANDFYQPAYQAIYEAAQSVHDARRPVDAVLVSQVLESRGELTKVGGYEAITKLLDEAGSRSNIGFYVSEVLDMSRRRQVMRVAHKIAEVAADLSQPIEAALAIIDELNSQRPHRGRGVPV